MKNKDLPAMPMCSTSSQRAEEGFYDPFAYGLTKREYFAGMAMAQMACWLDADSINNNAVCAVQHADALLKALELS